MNVIRGIQPDLLAASVATLGMFDGVHRGHQALLQSCRRHAERLGLPAVALTYEPHPSQVLHPERPTRLLTPLPEKLERLAAEQIDVVAIPDFTEEFSLLTPDVFLREVLVASLHPSVVVAGYRTTFGHARAGVAADLRAAGEQLGFAVEIVPPIEIAGGPVSSSRIRHCLEEGDITLAAELLGYTYQVHGLVTPGDGRGRQLGFPTANLLVPPEKLLPADGVYVVDVYMSGVQRRAVMSIGNRPTFARPRALEVYLLDFQGNLYGQTLAVTFLARLRGVLAFASVDALLEQIRQDIALARSY